MSFRIAKATQRNLVLKKNENNKHTNKNSILPEENVISAAQGVVIVEEMEMVL